MAVVNELASVTWGTLWQEELEKVCQETYACHRGELSSEEANDLLDYMREELKRQGRRT